MINTPIIWNITNKCYYSCSFCCLDANSSPKDLSLEDKLRIVENLDSEDIKVDVSGGDPLNDAENLEILKKLSRKFGRKKISIISTDKGLEKINFSELANYVFEVGFTYDFPTEPSPDRPLGYNQHNLELAKEVSKAGVETIAQSPLIKSNTDPQIIEQIYLNLNKTGIDRLLLMRFSESGRGILKKGLALTQKEINRALNIYRKLENRYILPKVKITPSVRGELLGKVLTSLNITNQGLLLSNPWVYNLGGEPKTILCLRKYNKR